jgi:hypothetical protein
MVDRISTFFRRGNAWTCLRISRFPNPHSSKWSRSDIGRIAYHSWKSNNSCSFLSIRATQDGGWNESVRRVEFNHYCQSIASGLPESPPRGPDEAGSRSLLEPGTSSSDRCQNNSVLRLQTARRWTRSGYYQRPWTPRPRRDCPSRSRSAFTNEDPDAAEILSRYTLLARSQGIKDPDLWDQIQSLH